MSPDYLLQGMEHALMMWAAATSEADKLYWWKLYVGYVRQCAQSGMLSAGTKVGGEEAAVLIAEKMLEKEGTQVVVKRLGIKQFIKRLTAGLAETGPLKHPVVILLIAGFAVVSTTHDVYAATKDVMSQRDKYALYLQRYVAGLGMQLARNPDAKYIQPPDTFDEWVNSGSP